MHISQQLICPVLSFRICKLVPENFTGFHYDIAAGTLVCPLLVGRSRDRSPVVSLGIFSVVPSDKTMCPEVDSASENEYQGFFLG